MKDVLKIAFGLALAPFVHRLLIVAVRVLSIMLLALALMAPVLIPMLLAVMVVLWLGDWLLRRARSPLREVMVLCGAIILGLVALSLQSMVR